MASETKTFHVGDILSITTDKLVSPEHIGGVYKILNHLTADNLFTHQLPRAGRECEPYLRACFPDLAAIEAPDFEGEEHVFRWLAEIVEKHGETREVEPMRDGIHEYRNPLAEAEEMMPGKVIPLVVDLPSPGTSEEVERGLES